MALTDLQIDEEVETFIRECGSLDEAEASLACFLTRVDDDKEGST